MFLRLSILFFFPLNSSSFLESEVITSTASKGRGLNPQPVTPCMGEVTKNIKTAEVMAMRVLASIGHVFAGQQAFYSSPHVKQLVSCRSNWLLNKTGWSGSRLRRKSYKKISRGLRSIGFSCIEIKAEG